MAWQVLLVRLPDSLGSLDALPEDYAPPALGVAADVLARIGEAVTRACVPFERPEDRLIVVRTDDFVIEAELGGTDDVDRVLVSILGSDAAWPLVSGVARALGAAAIDCETDELLDPDLVPDTLREWQGRIDEFRD